ncbi:MAG TPA: amidohydrolase/deacetylase family metallohydrolase [Vicinamibacterales bacterium]|nr:amidohydrolase/deacetylase family metallohydrolase [Vicinamibacterales bacterium]
MVSRRAFLAATSAAFVAPLVRMPGAAAARYDLIVKAGRVVDPAQRIDRIADVAVAGGRIAAIQPNLATDQAGEIVDARGRIVTPGWIDLHVHVGAPDLTPGALLRDGVTAMVDGGSAGADNIDALVKVADAAPNRVRIFLNVARTGVRTPGELLDIGAADVDAARQAIERHRRWIAGVKVRLSESVAGEHDLEALRRARQVAGPLPVMLHVGQTHSPLPKILDLLRPGDIVTHPYSPPPHGIMTGDGRVIPEVAAARRRGVRFDVGNGRTAHITWEVVENATRDGFWPDTISSDITGPGRTFRVFDLPTVVSKFLMLGMPLPEAIACVTSHAAASVSAFKDLGTLRVGAAADISVLELRDGEFEFVDNIDGKRIGRQKLFTTAVVMNGAVVRRNGEGSAAGASRDAFVTHMRR